LKLDNGGSISISYHGVTDRFAIALGIEVEEKKLDVDFGGYIPANPPSRPKPVIWLDSDDTDIEHRNFTYFHEISHHLIREDDEIYAFLNTIADRNDDLISLEERFANIGAAEFLVPSTEVSNLVFEKGFSISLLPELDSIFPASKPAISIQLAQCAPHRCFVVVCEFGNPPRNQPLQEGLIQNVEFQTPHLFVRYATNSPSQDKYSIASYTTIPQDHLLSKVYETHQKSKGKDRIPFRSGKMWTVDCEAIYYKGRVYASFNITHPLPSSFLQPSLF
jgi:hypothetical protein